MLYASSASLGDAGALRVSSWALMCRCNSNTCANRQLEMLRGECRRGDRERCNRYFVLPTQSGAYDFPRKRPLKICDKNGGLGAKRGRKGIVRHEAGRQGGREAGKSCIAKLSS